jgi:hypothetical protein
VTFLTWLSLSIVFKIPSRLSFLLGIGTIIISGIMLITDHQGAGLRLATYAFGFFIIATISYIREIKTNE